MRGILATIVSPLGRPATRQLFSRIGRRLRRHVASAIFWRARRATLPAISRAFADLQSRGDSRAAALWRMAQEAVRVRRLAASAGSGDSAAQHAFLDALAGASHQAAMDFRPPGLQSYVDVSVRMVAIRALAEIASEVRPFGHDVERVTSALASHLPGDRAALLAHADVLMDRSRPEEAAPLIRRALRTQAVCQTAQTMLSRAVEEHPYDLSDRFCPLPFTHLSTSFKGDAFSCLCSAWVPYPVGNVVEAPSAEAIWNSDGAAEIRRSILDGDFRYCSRTLCSYIAARSLPLKAEITDPVLRRYIDERTTIVEESPVMLQMNHDQSCNLACPSCRTSVLTAGPDEQRVYVDAAERVLLPLLRGMDGMTYISGGGEAFASAHYRKILGSLNRDDFPHLSIFLISNGQLLNAARWTEFPRLPEMIGNLSISIDAARAETYERLRRPGRWSVLMENLQLMAKMRATGEIRRLQINFVVQADNFRELPEFIALGDQLGVDSFWLQRLTNYGSYAEPVFAEADVTSPEHPEHAELLTILRHPLMEDPRIDLDMLKPILPEFVRSEIANPELLISRRSEDAARGAERSLRSGLAVHSDGSLT